MIWVFAILIVLAMGGVAAVAAGRGSGLAPEDDGPRAPSGTETPLDADGLRRVRFGLALRGYRMAEVDALLDRLAAREELREAERGPARRATPEPLEPSEPPEMTEPPGSPPSDR